MTDQDRFRLDQELQERHRQAKADLSRLKQEAARLGAALEGLGRSLQVTPATLGLWEDRNGRAAWRWTYSPDAQTLKEIALPEWRDVGKVITDIKSVVEQLPGLEADLRARGLAVD